MRLIGAATMFGLPCQAPKRLTRPVLPPTEKQTVTVSIGDQIKMGTAGVAGRLPVVCRNTIGCAVATYNEFIRAKFRLPSVSGRHRHQEGAERELVRAAGVTGDMPSVPCIEMFYGELATL